MLLLYRVCAVPVRPAIASNVKNEIPCSWEDGLVQQHRTERGDASVMNVCGLVGRVKCQSRRSCSFPWKSKSGGPHQQATSVQPWYRRERVVVDRWVELEGDPHPPRRPGQPILLLLRTNTEICNHTKDFEMKICRWRQSKAKHCKDHSPFPLERINQWISSKILMEYK